MSVENFLDLGNEKIPRSSRITAGLGCVKQQQSFQKYHLPERAASRPGVQVPGVHWFSCVVAVLRLLP
jgi:hypothetical protein